MSLQTQDDPKNEAEITYWDSAGGRRRVERQQSQDFILGPILQATLERAQPRRSERVVDIGCGTGASSIALAERVGPSGQVPGVDGSRSRTAVRETFGMVDGRMVDVCACGLACRRCRRTLEIASR
jgi:predicted TPR repeat methyltransferase